LKSSPIFSKTYDFVKWLIPLTIKFPRTQRFILAEALQEEALRFQGYLIEAVHQPAPVSMLTTADGELDKIRTHLRLCRDLALISPGQYEHAAGMLTEIGRLLGGWKRSLQPAVSR
jgi:hypothetical protein